MAALSAASSAVSITANAANNSYGAWSEGAGSAISLSVPVTITTSGGSSYGFFATRWRGDHGRGGRDVGPREHYHDRQRLDRGLRVRRWVDNHDRRPFDRHPWARGSRRAGDLRRQRRPQRRERDDARRWLVRRGRAPSGSSISATGTAITTLGNVDVAGVQPVDAWIAGAGATATLNNDTLVASGVQGLGVLATGGGVATISGGSITVSGTDADGLLASGAGSMISTSSGTKIVSSATPLNFVIAGAEAENSATINLTDASVATSGAGTSGVEALSGGTANLLGVAVSTTGSDAPAVVVNGVGSLATLSGANSLTTTGDGSIGLYALGGGVIDATGPTTISTGNTSASTGLSAFGVNADGAGSIINLAATTVTTLGTNAYGFYASNGGTISAPDAPSITTSGNGAIGLYALGRRVDHYRRRRLDRHARRLSAGRAGRHRRARDAEWRLGDDHGTAAHAVFVNGVGSLATLNGSNVLTTSGDGAIGLYALGGGVIDATGPTAISTGNTSSATGLSAFGVNADGAGSKIDLAGDDGHDGRDERLSDSTPTTAGRSPRPTRRGSLRPEPARSAFMPRAAGRPSPPTARRSSRTASRAGRAGRRRRARDAERRFGDDDGRPTRTGVRERRRLAGDARRRECAEPPAAMARSDFSPLGGGVIDATGPITISTGNDFDLDGPRRLRRQRGWRRDRKSISPRRASRRWGRTPMGSTPTTAATISAPDAPSITTSGNGSIGLYASGGGSTITADGASIVTHGASAPGVQADAGGLVTLNGGTVATTGSDAHAVFVNGAGSLVTLGGASVLNTAGAGSIGLYALGGGVINATGPITISTLGTTSTSTGPQRLRRERRRRGIGKSISPPRRSRQPARARSDFTPATSRRPAAAAPLRCRDN